VKYLDEFRSAESAHALAKKIKMSAGGREMTFMEVCGTHTMAIARNGIRELLPENITLISGPGCPVCVTPNRIIDRAVAFARMPDVVVVTFGDMMKVPGSSSSLDREHAKGGDIRIVTSTLEALAIAGRNPDKKTIFIGVGFETTSPTVAASIDVAQRSNVKNYFVLCAHKVMPPAMDALSRGKINIDGYLCPGHVSTIIGSIPYEFLVKEYGICCVIAGFEPLDILQGISMLVEQMQKHEPRVEIQYSRVVRAEGNTAAQSLMREVFDICDSEWRGIGSIQMSGFKIREKYSNLDAKIQIPVKVEPIREPEGCICGRVLQGMAKPVDCCHFGKSCTPDNPVGPCMVSSEGTCAAYFKYKM
jgi:hydrogenase expression/formation protein HypD